MGAAMTARRLHTRPFMRDMPPLPPVRGVTCLHGVAQICRVLSMCVVCQCEDEKPPPFALPHLSFIMAFLPWARIRRIGEPMPAPKIVVPSKK